MDNLVNIYKSMEVASGLNLFVSQNGPSTKLAGKVFYYHLKFLFYNALLKNLEDVNSNQIGGLLVLLCSHAERTMFAISVYLVKISSVLHFPRVYQFLYIYRSTHIRNLVLHARSCFGLVCLPKSNNG